MKESGMLFSAPMVRALLDGSKTQTRRVIKTLPNNRINAAGVQVHATDAACHCPYGQPGDRIWVRETWGKVAMHCLTRIEPATTHITYRAGKRVYASKNAPANYDFDKWPVTWADDLQPTDGKWRPSIHMPRAASRINLEITGARVERLQDISDADCLAEGIDRMKIGHMPFYRNYLLSDEDAQVSPMFEYPLESYRSLWESLNGAGSWDANPWVWVIEFKRL